MGIDWLRDLIICIFGLVATGVLIFIAVLLFSLYKRVRSVLDSVQAILGTVQNILAYTGDKLVRPAVQLLSMIQGIRQGIDAVRKFSKKR